MAFLRNFKCYLMHLMHDNVYIYNDIYIYIYICMYVYTYIMYTYIYNDASSAT